MFRLRASSATVHIVRTKLLNESSQATTAPPQNFQHTIQFIQLRIEIGVQLAPPAIAALRDAAADLPTRALSTFLVGLSI